MRLIFCFLSLVFSQFAFAIAACSVPPTVARQICGYGVCASTCEEYSIKSGNNPAYWSMVDVGGLCYPYFVPSGSGNLSNSATGLSYSGTPSCLSGTTLAGSVCVSDAFSALPRDKQAAVVVKDYSTQAAADAACARGVSAAQAGKTLDQIAAASMGNASACPSGQSSIGAVGSDGVYHLKCYNSKGDLMSADGVNTPAGQAVADAQAAADLAAASAAAAAASAAAASVANAAANSNNSSNAASSTPPVPTMPDSVAASGIFYTKGAITGGKTLSDVLTNFKAQISTTPIIAAATKFFSFSGLNGASCPVSSFSFTLFEHSYSFTLDLFCGSLMDTFLTVCAVLFMISAAYYSFRIAFM